LDAPKKKADNKPEDSKTVQHLAESLDRKLQVDIDLFYANTTVFTRFKIQLIFKQRTEEKNIQIT